MSEIFAIDYADMKVPTGCNAEDVLMVSVTVVSGDELLTIVKKDGTITQVDSCPGGRFLNYFDYQYIVSKDELPQWMERKTSYSWDETEGADDD